MTPVKLRTKFKLYKILLLKVVWLVNPTLWKTVRVLALPATLILPFSWNFIPFIFKSLKITQKKYLNTYFIYRKKVLYFQKLILYIVETIQFVKMKGSLSFKERYISCKDSLRKSLGPKTFLKYLTFCAQIRHWAFSPKVRLVIKKLKNLIKTFFPEQNSKNLTKVL
jgi:hypothetical protein